MSISSMTNVALAREGHAPRLTGTREADAAAVVPRVAGPPNNQVTSALSAITTYVPTEIITLYVAARAALSQTAAASATITSAANSGSEWLAFYLAMAITPLVVWLVYAAKLRAANQPLPLRPSTWPIWEMFAATTAFAVWATALPNSPFSYFSNWYSPAVAGLAVLVVSTMLGLVAPIFRPARS